MKHEIELFTKSLPLPSSHRYIMFIYLSTRCDIYPFTYFSIHICNSTYVCVSELEKGKEPESKPFVGLIIGIDPDHCDNDAAGSDNVHILPQSKTQGCPHAIYVLRSARRPEGKVKLQSHEFYSVTITKT